MKSLSIIAFALLTSFHQAFAAADADVLAYEIPPDAIKTGPHLTKSKYRVIYFYLLPGSQKETEQNKIAVEYVNELTHVVVERQLRKQGKLFGVQKEWYPNGQLKSEAPMRDGLRDGTFRHWDEQGQLVGQYEMTAGTGIVVIYSSQGEMIQQIPYKDNQQDGLYINMDPITHFQRFSRCYKGKFIGVRSSIYGEGLPATVEVYSLQGQSHGPSVGFTKDGHLYPNRNASWGVHWYVNEKEVSEKEYKIAAAKDPSLPPYFADATRYKELITPEMWMLLKNFREQPKVKIPLEFDAQNRPVLATP